MKTEQWADRTGIDLYVSILEAEFGYSSGLRLAVAHAAGSTGRGVHEAERQLAAAFPARRRAEFLAGREALHRALGRAGLDSGPVLRDGPRPRLPAGVRASISHSQGVAVALAGPAARYRTLGVDIELCGPPTAAAHLVLNRGERHLFDRSAPDAADRLLALYSAKEAAFKALSPLLEPEELPGLRAVRLTPRQDGWQAAPVARPGLRVAVSVRRLGAGVLGWALPAG
ncbi:4'-phosphopantetheinyl transferase [Kitasatospora sp. NPDC058115]|uniref:4'-phosphopantetheinyl transferase family protein n=1 Tax=Kitasatospora sp. NPDC058115 TaxID=3346347 RepID=UPI0036DB3292